MGAPLKSVTEPAAPRRYVYVSFSMDSIGTVESDLLPFATERHRVDLAEPVMRHVAVPVDFAAAEDLAREISAAGIVLEMRRGVPGRWHMTLARAALKKRIAVFFYWPEEQACERVDGERLRSYLKLFAVFKVVERWRGQPSPLVADQAPDPLSEIQSKVQRAQAAAKPVPLPSSAWQDKVKGTGVYLRTDYWATIKSGGSYGHTCYVAKELAATTENLVCFMGAEFALLNQLGLQQIVLQRPFATASEAELLGATEHYYRQLRAAFLALRPSYIYERLCLGNFVGALLAQELGIPYIVEYNGSEISMAKSFGGQQLRHAALFEMIEDLAFRQATVISVVSAVIADSLIQRGVDADKILVNPNGADPDAYAPPTAAEREEVRRGLGLDPKHRVIGFCGTFGGWHGVDVLAKALPRVCERDPEIRWLLIGDGQLRPMVDAEVQAHGLADRVVSTGSVPQQEGAKLLKACDIYVSPHSSNMVDSPFFGSPTKLFEYMAMGGAIVASDLQQIGQVLSPAFRVTDLGRSPHVTNQRAVLVEPGNVTEFVEAVALLAGRPDLSAALGRNAREALLAHYSWKRHIDRLWSFATGSADQRMLATASVQAVGGGERRVQGNLVLVSTEDAYKDEVQNQWNNNPCGSHYAKSAPRRTLEWFLEIERYRYDDYAPWMPETMEFARHAGRKVLEIGGGVGTDLAQFAKHGAIVTDYDLSAGHLDLAKQNFALRGLSAEFLHGDAERLPFDDNGFDVVYSNGVIHHTPNTGRVLDEIYRVLKPGGKAIVMVYAEDSLHYWDNLVRTLGMKRGMLYEYSMGEIMSRNVEITENDARPLVKVYTKRRLRQMFGKFDDVTIVKRQLTRNEVPVALRWMPSELLGRFVGWNLIAKARKPLHARP